jgi:two-component system, cell cycle response regulator DivK
VLIVDDNEDTREMYAWCLRAAGWFVETVANGADALCAAPAFEPDVIVMDLGLPVVGGLDAIERLKREEDTKHVPIVALTGYTTREREARAAGSDAFVVKPCEPDALRELLEAIVTGH